MALDAATLALTAAELKATLTDAKIAKLFEPTRDELVLTLRTRTDTYALLLSARSGSARVCLTEESFENPETPPSFCMLMRKHLTGGKLLDVRRSHIFKCFIQQKRSSRLFFPCGGAFFKVVKNRLFCRRAFAAHGK